MGKGDPNHGLLAREVWRIFKADIQRINVYADFPALRRLRNPCIQLLDVAPALSRDVDDVDQTVMRRLRIDVRFEDSEILRVVIPAPKALNSEHYKHKLTLCSEVERLSHSRLRGADSVAVSEKLRETLDLRQQWLLSDRRTRRKRVRHRYRQEEREERSDHDAV